MRIPPQNIFSVIKSAYAPKRSINQFPSIRVTPPSQPPFWWAGADEPSIAGPFGAGTGRQPSARDAEVPAGGDSRGRNLVGGCWRRTVAAADQRRNPMSGFSGFERNRLRTRLGGVSVLDAPAASSPRPDTSAGATVCNPPPRCDIQLLTLIVGSWLFDGGSRGHRLSGGRTHAPLLRHAIPVPAVGVVGARNRLVRSASYRGVLSRRHIGIRGSESIWPPFPAKRLRILRACRGSP
jgi:hypothetical protein